VKHIPSLKNIGNEPIGDWHIDVEIPAAILEHPEKKDYYVGSRSTKTHSFFRVSQFDYGTKIFPGDTLRAITVEYFMDYKIFTNRSNLFQETIRATVYSKGVPKTVQKSVEELENF
jgi:hypothetical protein